MDIEALIPAENNTDAKDWDLFPFARTYVFPGSTILEGDAERYAERTYVLHEIVKLSRIRCVECMGYGHAAIDCITTDKLTLLGKMNDSAKLIVAAYRKKPRAAR